MAAMGRAAAVLVLMCMALSVAGQTVPELEKELMAKEFVNILGAVEKAGLLPVIQGYLSSGGKATIFIPKDNFFPYHVDTGVLEKLKTDEEFLSQILQFHVIPGVLLRKPSASFGAPYEAIKEGEVSYNTLAGIPLAISRTGTKVTVDKSPAKWKFLDQIVLSNLVVHGINGLLIPPALLDNVTLTNVSCLKVNQCTKPPPKVPTAVPPTPPPVIRGAPPPVGTPPIPSPGPASPPAPSAKVPPPPAPGPSEGPGSQPQSVPDGPGPAPAPLPVVEGPGPAPGPSAFNEIIEALKRAGTYTTLLAAVKLYTLEPYFDKLADAGRVTVLAPDDEAFKGIPQNLQPNLQSINSTFASDLIMTHILNVYVTMEDIKTGPLTYQSINKEQNLYFNVTTVGFTKTPNNFTANFVTPATILDDPTNQISVLGISKVLLMPSLPAPAPESTGARLLPSVAVSFLLVIGGLLAL